MNYDPRFDRFSFGTMYTYPVSEDSANPVPLKETMSLYEILYPAVCETGFFDKTKFRKLYVCFVMVKPGQQPLHEIDYRNVTSKGTLSVGLSVTEQELTHGNYATRRLQAIAEVLKHVCSKYGLDAKPVEDLIRKFGAFNQDLDGFKSGDEVVIARDELHIHLRLRGEFPDASEFIANSELMDELNGVLKQAGVGSITGSEAGTGYETLFCEGPDAQAMYSVISRVLDRLPQKSYLELLSSGRKKTIEI